MRKDGVMEGGACYTTLLEDEKVSLLEASWESSNQQSILRNILVHNLFTRKASPGLCCVSFYCKCGGF